MRFGVRPFPEGMESLAGYLVRLGRRNGLASLQEVVGLCDSRLSAKARPDKWGAGHCNRICEGLALRLGRDSKQIIDHFQYELVLAQSVDPLRMIKNLKTGMPRICTCCTSKNGFMDWRWGLGHLAHCQEHGTPLVDCCPSCGNELSWKPELLERCPSCKITWSEAAQKKQPISNLEMTLWSEAVDGHLGDAELLREISSSMVLMARPFDSALDPINGVPLTPNLWQLTASAYTFLAAKKYQKTLMKERSKRKALPGIANDLSQRLSLIPPMKSANKRLPVCPETALEMHAESGRMEFVTAKRKAINGNGSDAALENHITASSLSSALGISMRELRWSIEAQCMTALNDTQVIRQKVFDIRDLATLPTIQDEKLEHQPTTIVEMSDLRLDRHLTGFGRLLAKVWGRELCGYLFWDNNLPKIVVDETHFLGWLSEELEVHCTQNVECYLAMAALHCGKSKLMSLVAAGELECIDWESGGRDQITGRSFFCYVRKLYALEPPVIPGNT
ncbi:TniQ family protein [Marinobacter sp.]|uniref:TniQ family protein n=1 Tax=Marinobacter sp. TaxID=50741 RepID=UPI003A905742